MTQPDDTPAAGHWRTASFGDPPDTSPMELDDLGRHLRTCRLDGGGATLQCALQAVRGFIAAHLVTSAAALAVLVAVAWLAA